jgi:hypothetical protein
MQVKNMIVRKVTTGWRMCAECGSFNFRKASVTFDTMLETPRVTWVSTIAQGYMT